MNMPITTVHQDSLISLSSIMSDASSVFIVPTFQRPFAWGEKQLDDLKEDINKTMRMANSDSENIHYLAPIHLIPYKNNPSDKGNNMLKAYLPENDDIKALLESLDDKGNEFINSNYDILNVYFVIDGQQRLTTLHFIYQFIYTYGTPPNPLDIKLKSGKTIPRLIQNPTDDHSYFVELRNNIKDMAKLRDANNTQAQKRMYKAVENIATWNDWTSMNDFTKFLKSSALKSLLIELEPNYGLTSFQTLNDRGKGLTALEKFKSLLLEYDLNENGGKLAHSLHIVFSSLYQTLDEGIHSGLFPKGEAGDNRLMQYIFVYVRISKSPDNYWQSGEGVYTELRKELISSDTKDKSGLLNEWLHAMQEVCEQLKHMNDCLLGKVPDAKNPSFICKGRTIKDDYNIIIRSLKLSSRSIAVLLKFRAMYNVEWHDRFSISCICNRELYNPLSEHLKKIRGGTKKDEIIKLIDKVEDTIPIFEEKPSSYQSDYSMLQAVERMELLVWQRYNPRGGFRNNWNVTFKSKSSPKDAVTAWYSWYHVENDFPRFVQDNEHEPTFRYVLREYESYLNKGAVIHFDNDLTLEHIFPQNPDPKPPAKYGFGSNPNDYDSFINRIGNLTFVYQNASLSNELPYIKASRYLDIFTVKGHKKNQPEITRLVANQLCPLATHYSAYQDDLRIRCTELAIFSLKRFFC